MMGNADPRSHGVCTKRRAVYVPVQLGDRPPQREFALMASVPLDIARSNSSRLRVQSAGKIVPLKVP